MGTTNVDSKVSLAPALNGGDGSLPALSWRTMSMLPGQDELHHTSVMD